MKFNKQQIDSLISIMQKHQTLFISDVVGLDHLNFADRTFLRSFGVDLGSFRKYSKIEKAYYFGMVAQVLGDKETKGLTYPDFKKFFENNKHIPLSVVEQEALSHLKTRAYNDLSGLGNRMRQNFSNMLLTSNKKEAVKARVLIKKKSIEAIKERKSQNWLASELRNQTKDWARDFDRIADCIMHEAYDTGRSVEIQKEYGDDAKVYKDVYDGACEHCIRLYLTNGIGSKPIIFKLNELIANGTNIGVKTKDWKPVIGFVHPFCRCTLSHVPPNSIWNPKTRSFSTVIRKKYGVKRKSKVKITLNGEEI